MIVKCFRFARRIKALYWIRLSRFGEGYICSGRVIFAFVLLTNLPHRTVHVPHGEWFRYVRAFWVILSRLNPSTMRLNLPEVCCVVIATGLASVCCFVPPKRFISVKQSAIHVIYCSRRRRPTTCKHWNQLTYSRVPWMYPIWPGSTANNRPTARPAVYTG